MGIKVTGVEETVLMLENVSARSSRKALHALEEGAEEIAELASKFAPVDEGNLEDAIIVDDPDRGGINRRKRLFVAIDEARAVPDREGKSIADYALEMHEGDYKLGEKSRAKAAREGVTVGPKFMERAADELDDEISFMVDQALKEGL